MSRAKHPSGPGQLQLQPAPVTKPDRRYSAGIYEQAASGWRTVEWSRHSTERRAVAAAQRYARGQAASAGGSMSWSAWWCDGQAVTEVSAAGLAGPGRPPAAPEAKRSRTISVAMTAEEHDARATAAWLEGVSLSDWMRAATERELAERARRRAAS